MNRKPFNRCSRVSIEIHRVISDLIKKNISDPRLKSVTITSVKVSRDLRIAKVYFTMYKTDNTEIEKTIEGFMSAKGYVKREIARQMNLRYMPDVIFFYDESFDYGAHMNKILTSIKLSSKPNGNKH